jgi:hypothetical protein
MSTVFDHSLSALVVPTVLYDAVRNVPVTPNRPALVLGFDVFGHELMFDRGYRACGSSTGHVCYRP